MNINRLAARVALEYMSEHPSRALERISYLLIFSKIIAQVGVQSPQEFFELLGSNPELSRFTFEPPVLHNYFNTIVGMELEQPGRFLRRFED